VTPKAAAVVEFLQRSLGASVERRFDRPDRSIMHAEIRIDDTIVMVGQSGDTAVPAHLHVYVPDVDATYEAALKNGGESLRPPERKGDPDRRGGVMDPAGNTWWFSTQVED
jgi:uncharacterized glyoxalase superfamily protein PhnB